MRQPVVENGSPAPSLTKYELNRTDGIDVYVSEDIRVKKDELIIRRARILFVEYLSLKNIYFEL